MTKQTEVSTGGFPYVPYNVFSGAKRMIFHAPDEGGAGSGAGAAGGQQGAQGAQQGNAGGQQGSATGSQSGGQSGSAGGQQTGNATQAITFNSQDELDEMIEKRLGKARRQWERESGNKTGGNDGQQGNQNGNGKTYTQADLEAHVNEHWAPKVKGLEDELTKLRGFQIDNAILSAANNAYDPNQIVKLLRDDIGLDDHGNPIVLNASGNPRLGANGKPISVSDYVSQFRDQNKHLFKGVNTSGAGSSSNNGNGTGSAFDPSGLKTMDQRNQALASFLGGAKP